MTKPEREIYWRGHVNAAQSHPESLAAYCRETGIGYQSLLNWKRRWAAARFIELEPPEARSEAPIAPTAEAVLHAELGSELRLAFAAECSPGWAAAFVASLHTALDTALDMRRAAGPEAADR